MENRNMSHNACSVYDYSRLCWKVQPGDMVAFRGCKMEDCVCEVRAISAELLWIRRLTDDCIFVISTYDMNDWSLRRVDSVKRLSNGIFSVGDRVSLNGELNLPGEEHTICKFENGRVKVSYRAKGRLVGWFYVREGEILNYLEVE